MAMPPKLKNSVIAAISIVEPGVIIRVSEQDADDLIAKGLAFEV